MPALAEVSTIVGTIAVIAGGITWSVRHVLRTFHAEHIGPVFSDISHAIKENTTATSNLTDRMEQSDEAQKECQTENRKTFERMGEILADHETRITVIEAAPDAVAPKPAKATRRRAS